MKTQEDSDIEKRLLVAILLSMAILFVTPYVYRQIYPDLGSKSQTESEVVESLEVGGESGEQTGAAEPLALAEPAEAEMGSDEADATAAEVRTFQVESDTLLLQFSSRDAMVTSVHLKEVAGAGGEPLELLPEVLPEELRGVLRVQAESEEANELLEGAVFEVEGVRGDRIRAPAVIGFRYRKSGIEVIKKVTVPADGYEVSVQTKVLRGGRSIPFSVELGSGIGDLGGTADFGNQSIAYFLGDSVERYDEGDLAEGSQRLEIMPDWVVVDSKYFATGILDAGGIRSLEMRRQEWTQEVEGEEGVSEEKTLILLRSEVGLERDAEFRVFFGPKRHEILEQSHASLPRLVDYGWFGIIVAPLLTALKFIYGFIGNYGWAIIILTFLINLALFPVRYKQMASMQKMSEIQPKLRSIQDKYKRMKRDDPRRQQMNVEVMALYKEHGVNPLGGCFPLLFQMPILFAFFRMLDASIELRGAPFMLWIQDLSKADPYYITPVVMGLTMVAQQKMTPATGDATQRKMMMFLPIVFTFFFLNVSSGLAIYFLFSNLFGMMLQFLLQKVKPGLAARKASRGKSRGSK